MRDQAYALLERFYNCYRDALQVRERLRDESVLVSSLKVKSNVRYSSLKEASLASTQMDHALLEELLGLEFVRETDEALKYAITAKGIWIVEKATSILTEDGLIEFLDEKNFSDLFDVPGLSEKEKIVLFALLAARVFSPASPVDLKKDDATMDAWKRVIEKVFDKFEGSGMIGRTKREDLFGAAGNEHPVSNLVRHSDALPKKIFKALGKQRYCLDIYEASKISTERLAYLLRLVFEGKIDSSRVYEFLEFCKSIAYNDGIFLFDQKTHTFSKPEIDDVIKEALLEATLPSRSS
jgi:predicted transcriptional regulator